MNIYHRLMSVALPFASIQICAVVELTVPLEPMYAHHGVGSVDLSAPVKTKTVVTEPTAILSPLDDEARERSCILPLLFGVSMNYMDIRQNINIDNINFTGLSLHGRNIDCGKDPACKHAVNNIFVNEPVSLDNAFQIDVGNTRESSKAETFKLDA